MSQTLKEYAVAENQHPGDVALDIAALGPLDHAIDLGVVDAFSGTTAIYKKVKNRRAVV